MFNCQKCQKWFRDSCDFKRHQARTKPCAKNNSLGKSSVTEKSLTVDEKQSFEDEKQSFRGEKRSLDNENKICKYCLHTFSTKKYLKIHQKNCKYLDDPIRNLEIENDIIPELPESITECRFCNKIYHNTSNLNKHITNCKEREVYHKILIKEKEQKTVTNVTINNNCNNVNNNNQLILNFGQENLTHIQTENIINLIRDIRKEFGNDQVYLMAGNLVTSFDNYIRETPENNNLRIHDSKCLYAEVKNKFGWEKTSIDRSLNKAFKSSANQLYNKKEEINNHNGRVFASEINQDIFSEIKQFSGKGFEHSYNPTELRKVLTGYKISKLKNKNKNEIDF